MNKNDLRFQKTEKIIIESFTECVNEYGFDKTTIALICEKGLISRNTFYFHYEDKYDLMNHLYKVLEDKMKDSLTDKTIFDLMNYSVRDSVEWTYNEIEKNRELITLLIKCSRRKMNDLFKKVFIEAPLTKMIDNYFEISTNIELLLIKNYLVDAMVGYIATWLDHYDEIDTEEIIDIMEQLCTVPVETYFDKLFSHKDAQVNKLYITKEH